MMFSIGPGGWPVFFGLISVLYLVLLIYTLVDIVRSQFKDPKMKVIWIFIILVAQIFGPLLYWLLAAEQKA